MTAVTDHAAARPESGFASLGLPDDLLSAVFDLGFTSPTDVQAEAIPLLLAGRDVVGVARTGTGKTAAFGLPLLAAVDPRLRAVQALVLAPTRELALQVSQAISSLAAHLPGVQVLPIYGGASFTPQLRGLRQGAQVVVGTPGRVMDLMAKGSLDLSGVGFLVLDEADEMLRMGFAEDVDHIAAQVPQPRRTALFSATMPAAITKVAATHLTNPAQVSMTPGSPTVETVHQTYAVVPFRHKSGALARVLAVSEAEAAIVFVRTKSAADDVATQLGERGVQAAAISGDVAQRDREKLINRLRSGTLDVLVATDVAARGLDVDRIGLVVNFDVPRDNEIYIHRIGRTGRAGRSGQALTFFTPREHGRLRQIERATGSTLTQVTIPTPADVSAQRARTLLAQVEDRLAAGRLDHYHQILDATEHDVRETAAALLALAAGDEGPAPRSAQPRDDSPRRRREERFSDSGDFVGASFEEGRAAGPRRSRPAHSGTRAPGARSRRHEAATRYRVEVGHRDGVQPGAIVGAITGEGGLRGQHLGKIDIFPTFSLVEIGPELSQQTSRRIGAARVAGRPLRIRPDTGPRKPRR